MIIANPIFDVVFKRMMENEKVAKFFIGTLLNETIETLEFKPQEFTFLQYLDPDDEEVKKYVVNKLRERLTINVARLDFIATIKTKTGENKKILIEIQKAQNRIDLMRFRNYLAEQYKKEDVIEGNKQILPITTIYILGFNLTGIESACIKVSREYTDLIENKIIHQKSEFIESLTHDCYVVQVARISDRFQTSLDKILSIFEQNYFMDDRKIIKNFTHKVDIEELKLATDILHHAGTDPEARVKLETEQEGLRTIDALTGEYRKKSEELLLKIEHATKELNELALQREETVNQIVEQRKELEEKEKLIYDKNVTIVNKDKTIEEKDKTIKEKESIKYFV